ncbi:unnamed protein product [Rhizophagus irregularis]|nr:unnamed protein product [Rhizophagus irregularis]
MWPSNDQDTGDIDPGKKFVIDLKENHELWDWDRLVNHRKIATKKEKEEGKETQKLSQRAIRVASEFFLQNKELCEEITQLRQEVQEFQEEVQVQEDFSIVRSSQKSQKQLQEASSRDELVEQQQQAPPPLTSSEQYQLVAKNEIMLNEI